MDAQRVKRIVLDLIERAIDAEALTAELGEAGARPAAEGTPASTTQLLTRIVLGDILDDAILAARPQDRTFPLRLFFAEMGDAMAGSRGRESESDDEAASQVADVAFTFACGLNFFFRASMDAEAKARFGLEVSRQLYAFAHSATLDPALVTKAAPLLAALMSNDLERARFESVDHMKTYDSQVHERAEGSDPSSARIVRPASFLCRVAATNAVKAKAQVVT